MRYSGSLSMDLMSIHDIKRELKLFFRVWKRWGFTTIQVNVIGLYSSDWRRTRGATWTQSWNNFITAKVLLSIPQFLNIISGAENYGIIWWWYKHWIKTQMSHCFQKQCQALFFRLGRLDCPLFEFPTKIASFFSE